ncbi:MAG: aldo/keto reductase [Acetobacteraceae bacterium]|nr:aldo/keto reductase [Acetobacteraceae bacterium]
MGKLRLALGPGGAAPGEISALGQGTWLMAEGQRDPKDEEAALALGIDLGMNLIDTAEMYGSGTSEALVGRVIKSRGDAVFLVSKVYPHNASRTGAPAACARSLKRLGVERIDLYLLHWRGAIPLAETVAAFEKLKVEGKIGAWGVSNFGTADMLELASVPGGKNCAANQVLYHPDSRGIEFDLLPYCAGQNIAVMAYSPLGHSGGPLRSPALAEVAKRHGATPAQIAIAWGMRHPHVISIPKSGDVAHVRDNARAANIALTAADLAVIDAAHQPPQRKQLLDML